MRYFYVSVQGSECLHSFFDPPAVIGASVGLQCLPARFVKTKGFFRWTDTHLTRTLYNTDNKEKDSAFALFFYVWVLHGH